MATPEGPIIASNFPGFASPETFCRMFLVPPFLVVSVQEMLSHSSVTCFCPASSPSRDLLELFRCFFFRTRCLTRPILALPIATGTCMCQAPASWIEGPQHTAYAIDSLRACIIWCQSIAWCCGNAMTAAPSRKSSKAPPMAMTGQCRKSVLRPCPLRQNHVAFHQYL